jgi:hypothetical protein
MCSGVGSLFQRKKCQRKIGIQRCGGKYADCEEGDLQWKNTPKDPYFQ